MSESLFRIAQLLRVLSLFVLIFPIPLTYRLLIIYLLDGIDCSRFWHPVPCNSFKYQWNDKLIDTLSYIVINAFLIWKYPSPLNFMLLGMLLFRIKGIVQWYQTGNSEYLIWHPDIFREFSLVVSAVNDGMIKLSPTMTVSSVFIISILKWMFEIKMHKKGVHD